MISEFCKKLKEQGYKISKKYSQIVTKMNEIAMDKLILLNLYLKMLHGIPIKMINLS